MVRVRRRASAGRMDDTVRSDCYVEVEVMQAGGITLNLESKVESLYGDAIRLQLTQICASLGVQHLAFRIVDRGALPCVLAARIETAIKRALPGMTGEYLPAEGVRTELPALNERLRRTRLYLPGNEPKFFPNAGLHRPDMAILDLEDSVSPAEKDAARILVRNALRSLDFYGAERAVRINQGEPGLMDLRMIVPHRPDLLLLPKCEDAETVRLMDGEVRGIEKRLHLRSGTLLLPIIESALGVVHAYAIATASSRVCALAIGLEDYTADIGVERTPEGKESLFARMAVLNAAKAAGIQALDSVYSDVDDLEGLRASTAEARALGFEGKGCIHPRQIAVIHAALAPSDREIERAEMIVNASQEARKAGSGVVALGSKMIDAPVVLRAERILRLAKQLTQEGRQR